MCSNTTLGPRFGITPGHKADSGPRVLTNCGTPAKRLSGCGGDQGTVLGNKAQCVGNEAEEVDGPADSEVAGEPLQRLPLAAADGDCEPPARRLRNTARPRSQRGGGIHFRLLPLD